MIQRMLQLRPAVNAVCCSEDLLRPYLLSDSNWTTLDQLKNVLEIFVQAGKHLSGSRPLSLPYMQILIYI